MGMAASQARFLGLTARKNNVEYEGQQINQQRTVLANETANYYNDLLGMSVPVPPSASDYTKTVYSFQDGALTNTITSMIAQADGLYKISYMMNWTDDFAAVSAASSIVTKVESSSKTEYANINLTSGFTKDGSKYKYNDRELTTIINGTDLPQGLKDKLSPDTSKQYYKFVDDKTGTTLYFPKDEVENLTYDTYGVGTGSVETLKSVSHYDYYVGAKEFRVLGTEIDKELLETDEYYKSLSNDQIAKLLDEEKEYKAILDKQYGKDSEWLVRYVKNTSSNEWDPMFTKLNTVESAVYEQNNYSLSYIPMYTVGAAKKNEEIKGVTARFEQDATGRIINITMNPGKEDQVTYAVTTNTVTDQAKYDDAMNQYEYDKALYDKAIQETNAKIEIIQAEDKNLELRLKQLDTEQEAIQTEMDAVQKVIEKNTESSFKTFG